ncbi:MAG: TIGR02147 family protein [Cryobacterium sp.]|nr:TIGR02147 family protein [Oligoflexia bacterium]
MPLPDTNDYRIVMKDLLRYAGVAKRGELLKLSNATGIHSSSLSQILQGNRTLTPEQALSISEYFELSEADTEAFLDLVHFDRAGTPKLRAFFANRIQKASTRNKRLVNVLPHETALPEDDRATFYSHWFYSAVRIVSAIPKYQSLEVIGRHFRVPKLQLEKTARFLVKVGLCHAAGDRLTIGPRTTHLEADSPFVSRHHANWRLRAMERHAFLSEKKELSYTSPMALSRTDALRIRARLVDEIKQVCEVVDASNSETAYCLNIDWFEF